jgi:Putative Ig domain
MRLRLRFPVILAIALLAGCLDKAEDIPTSPATASAARDAAITLSGTPAAEVIEGSAYFYQPLITQNGLGTVTYLISGKPAWMSFNSATGALNGTPAAADVGMTGDIVITATTSTLSGSVGPFRVNVRGKSAVPPANAPPTIAGTPSTMVTAGNSYSFAPTASDANGNTLSFAIANKPSWASFSTATGVISGTPAATNVGTYASIVISVSDGQAASSLPAFSIQVLAANRAPTIAGVPATTVTVGQGYSFMPSATDADGDTLSFAITGKPGWASFNTVTGALTGTPGSAAVGTYTGVTISVSDGTVTAILPAFTLQVVASAPVNVAPTISAVPASTVAAGSSYSFTPVASDANNDPLSFSVQNRPVWAAFSTASGALSGTPTSAQVGTYSNIVIAVSDGKVSTALPAFSIQVTAVNRPPTISGTPATSVMATRTYNFAPTATDPDGDALTYSIANKPQWASFNTASGALSGTPATAQVGSYAGVTISVSDGKASASLPAFTIAVTSAPASAVTLNWTTPTQNDDGTPLADLAGYHIAYGTDVNALSQLVDVAGAAATSYTFASLAGGTWYFTIRSYTNAGVESVPSNAASKTL